jgi:hypothetical protein
MHTLRSARGPVGRGPLPLGPCFPQAWQLAWKQGCARRQSQIHSSAAWLGGACASWGCTVAARARP